MNKNILKHIIRYLLMICIVIVCCTIFRFSSDQSTESSRTSVGVTKFIVSIIWQDNPEVNTDTLINTIHPIIRKVAHFSIYLLLGTLVMCCAQTFKGCKEYKFDASVMLCFFYACTDEFHQLFVPWKKRRIYRCMLRYSWCNVWNTISNDNSMDCRENKK